MKNKKVRIIAAVSIFSAFSLSALGTKAASSSSDGSDSGFIVTRPNEQRVELDEQIYSLKWFMGKSQKNGQAPRSDLRLRNRVPPGDYLEAVGYFSKAAYGELESGAFNNLGVIYAEGLGVPKDESIAVSYFLNEVSMNWTTHAEYNLGLMYLKGRGVSKDIKESYAWFSFIAMGQEDENNAEIRKLAGILIAEMKKSMSRDALSDADKRVNAILRKCNERQDALVKQLNSINSSKK